MSRLEEIAQRNANASKWSLKSNFAFGMRSIFLLVILVLLLFTSWALPPEDTRPGIIIVPGTNYRPSSGGTLLMRSPQSAAPARPAGSAAPTAPGQPSERP